MEDIILYMNHHVDIKSVFFLIGYQFNVEVLKQLLSQTRLRKMVILGISISSSTKESIQNIIKSCSEKDASVVPDSIEYVSFSYLSSMEPFDALVFDGICDVLDLAPAMDHSFKYILGNVKENTLSSFSVWEKTHDYVQHIYIKTFREGKSGQILNWDNTIDNNIELSVILPVYNVANYLDQCLKSITAWTAQYVEFIFVNDGSSDNSASLIESWRKKDNRIKLYNKENGGCASARQFGVEQAHGNYIGFVDPDDYIDKSMFQQLLSEAMIGSYDICYCGYNEYYEDSGDIIPIKDDVIWPFTDGVTDPLIIHSLIAYARVAIWRGIYKKEMINNAGIRFNTNLKRFDDLPFKVEIYTAAKSVYAIPKALYYYRLQRPGQDVSAKDERLFVHFDIFHYLNQKIVSTKDSRLIDWLQLCKLQTHRHALSILQNQFLKKYMKQAKYDMHTTGSTIRSFGLIKERLGKKASLYYLAIELRSILLLKILNKISNSNNILD